MPSNIYDIPDFSSGTTYNQNDIVLYQGFYYYSLTDSNLGNTPTIGSTSWGGRDYDSSGNAKPKFIWKPNYNSVVKSEPLIKLIKFGQGYEQRIQDLINNNLKSISLLFDLRTLKEGTAILHFLHTRAGAESFIWTPRSPYTKQRLWKCESWDDELQFNDNIKITTTFEEVVN